ncbi:hypothetical protein M2352_000882 [Azospirillum fermentarium]|uniref:hypothetical protein n=1 Tax=Azospirillum fermentarium TaxID=1233114 RepID=UPI00222665C2|nr:hypothetical protein [Azospirillum fermentarium]MCW2245291.1 hypothetical protein [Azospirillum fermentarium]
MSNQGIEKNLDGHIVGLASVGISAKAADLAVEAARNAGEVLKESYQELSPETKAFSLGTLLGSVIGVVAGIGIGIGVMASKD